MPLSLARQTELATELNARIQPHLAAARIAPRTLPDCHGLQLFLLNEDFPHDALSPAEMDWALNEPSYWFFCWASGLAQAQHILANPELVAGKRVLDFGTGSGVVAIAAAMAGAAEVVACDIDAAAMLACQANAELNGVSLRYSQDFYALDERFDVLFAADVLYDQANRVFLPEFQALATTVWLADSRVKNLQAPGYRQVAQVMATTLPDLNEFDEFRRVSLYRSSGVTALD